MRVDGQDLAVIIQCLGSISGFFVALSQQSQNEWVMLVALLQFRNRGLIVVQVERDVATEVGIEAHLVGIVALVQYRFGGGQMLRPLCAPAWLPDTDARQRALPAEFPQVLLGRAEVGRSEERRVWPEGRSR